MLGFPPSTEFNKRIPKQKFYENAAVPAAVKRLFADQLRCIYWRNKLAVSTLNLTAGERVTEIEIFELCLTGPKLDEAVLRQIDSEIPYHILFVLSYENKVQAWIGCKDTSANSSAKVSRYLHTDWMPETELSLAISGLSLEAVYDGLVRQIARLQGENWSAAYSIAENIQRSAEREKLQKQIAALENKIRKEKQFNLQVEMNAELKQLKKKKFEKHGRIIMNIYDQLLIEFPGIETTLTNYSDETHATMLLPSLKQALNEHDKERTLYCLEEMDGWYQKNLAEIYNNEYVCHKDEHQRIADLIHSAIQKVSEAEATPKTAVNEYEKINTVNSKEPIIFLSHCTTDIYYGNALEKFMTGLGVRKEQLIYSSHPLHKIPLDQNIFNYLRKNINRKIFMIILWSNDYLESPACMNELGAAWVAQCDYTNIYTPDFAFGNPKYHRCAVDTQKMGAVLNGDANCRQSMLELKDKIVNFLDLAPDEAQVLYLLDEFTNSLKAISKTSDRNSAENDLAVR